MGVPGLWEIINPAGQSRSLAHVAVVDGFENNTAGKRAYRVGIDVSIWFTHAASGRGGENPELRLLFFRLCNLKELPIIPLFVFDGRERPKVKRKSRLGKSGSHTLSRDFKKLLDCFGIQWREGVIDAVMSDDVDTLVFGATTVMMNLSTKLSGNMAQPAMNMDGKPSKYHAMFYTAENIRLHDSVRMTRGGLILYALLCSGDYDNVGAKNFGGKVTRALAELGYGDQLLETFMRRGTIDFQQFLRNWRNMINQEVATNASGKLRMAMPALRLPETFPDLQILELYADPLTSGKRGGNANASGLHDRLDMNLSSLASLCEEKFGDWGTKVLILERFRNSVWQAATIHILRCSALELDQRERDRRIRIGSLDLQVKGVQHALMDLVPPSGTSLSLMKRHLQSTTSSLQAQRDEFQQGNIRRLTVSQPGETHLITNITGARKHITTDYIEEFSVEINPAKLVTFAESGIRGVRSVPTSTKPPVSRSKATSRNKFVFNTWSDGGEDDEVGGSGQDGERPNSPSKRKKKQPADPLSPVKIFVPAAMLKVAHPGMVQDFSISQETTQTASQRKKDAAAEKKRRIELKKAMKEDEKTRERARKEEGKAQKQRDKAEAAATRAAKGKGKRMLVEDEDGLSAPKKRQRKAPARPPTTNEESAHATPPQPSPTDTMRDSLGLSFSMAWSDDPDDLRELMGETEFGESFSEYLTLSTTTWMASSISAGTQASNPARSSSLIERLDELHATGGADPKPARRKRVAPSSGGATRPVKRGRKSEGDAKKTSTVLPSPPSSQPPSMSTRHLDGAGPSRLFSKGNLSNMPVDDDSDVVEIVSTDDEDTGLPNSLFDIVRKRPPRPTPTTSRSSLLSQLPTPMSSSQGYGHGSMSIADDDVIVLSD